MKNYILIAALIIFINACSSKRSDNDVLFNQPQPKGVKNLNEFPLSYCGTFVDNDSNVLKISKTNAILRSQYQSNMSKQEVDTLKDCHIENNYLIDDKTKEKIPFTLKNDTLYFVSYITDTLYDLHKDIVRKHKGNLILNKEGYDNLWSVRIMNIKHDELQIRSFNSIDLFEKLTKLSNAEVVTDETKKRTIKKFLKPTKNQFESILNYKDSTLIVDVYKREKTKK